MLEKTIHFLDEKKFKIARGILVFLLFFYGAYVQYIPVYLFHIDLNHLTTANKVLLSTYSSCFLSLVFFLLYRKELIEDFKKFRKKAIDHMDIGFKCWFTGLGIMMVTNIIISIVFKGGGANNEKLVQEMIHSIPALMIINAGVLAPFNEELVFRKTLYDVIGKWKWIFIGLSFLLFGGAHVINMATVWKDYLYIIPYGVLGAAFAMAYYKTDTVFTSIFLHMIHNIMLILISISVL